MVEISWKTSEDHMDDATGLPPLMETPIGPKGMGSWRGCQFALELALRYGFIYVWKEGSLKCNGLQNPLFYWIGLDFLDKPVYLSWIWMIAPVSLNKNVAYIPDCPAHISIYGSISKLGTSPKRPISLRKRHGQYIFAAFLPHISMDTQSSTWWCPLLIAKLLFP